MSVATLVILMPGFAAAQTEGRVSVGASVTFVSPTAGDVANTVSIGPLLRLNPRPGWGAAGALNWFAADLEHPAGTADFARLRIRPLMAGIGYTTTARNRTIFNVSIVAGPSFNSARFVEGFAASQPGPVAIDAENSFAIRPGVSLTHTVAPRVGVTGFAGYMFNRPDVIYLDATGQQFENRWRADALVLSVGVVYSVF